MPLSAYAGFAIGFAGLAILFDPFGSGSVDRLGALVIVLSALAWAAGSLYARGARLPRRPLVSAGLGSLCGGVLLAIVSVALGELGEARFTTEGVLALGYLVVAGTFIGFSAYVWLLRAAPTSLVATYAYVNPVVAVILGWIILGEEITAADLGGGRRGRRRGRPHRPRERQRARAGRGVLRRRRRQSLATSNRGQAEA